MWTELEMLAEQYECWHLWQMIRSKDGITIYRCKKCGKVKNIFRLVKSNYGKFYGSAAS